jgi:MFS family permease
MGVDGGKVRLKEYQPLFRHRPFMLFLGGMVLLEFGRRLAWVALGWFVLQLTGLSASIGVIVSISTFAPLAFNLFAGELLDTYPRKWLLMSDSLARALLYALIPVFLLA